MHGSIHSRAACGHLQHSKRLRPEQPQAKEMQSQDCSRRPQALDTGLCTNTWSASAPRERTRAMASAEQARGADAATGCRLQFGWQGSWTVHRNYTPVAASRPHNASVLSASHAPAGRASSCCTTHLRWSHHLKAAQSHVWSQRIHCPRPTLSPHLREPAAQLRRGRSGHLVEGGCLAPSDWCCPGCTPTLGHSTSPSHLHASHVHECTTYGPTAQAFLCLHPSRCTRAKEGSACRKALNRRTCWWWLDQLNKANEWVVADRDNHHFLYVDGLHDGQGSSTPFMG